MNSILLYAFKTWPLRLAKEIMFAVFDNDSICRILHVSRRNCMQSVKIQHDLCLSSIPVKRPDGELIKDLLLPTSPRTWHRPVDDVGKHDHGIPGAPLRTASLLVRTIEKGLDLSLKWYRTWPLSLGCLHPWRVQLDWRYRLKLPPINATKRIKLKQLVFLFENYLIFLKIHI